MRGGLGYPLRAILEGAQTVVGWTILTVALMFLGYASGYMVGHRHWIGFGHVLERFFFVFGIWVIYPQIIVAYVVTFTGWIVPIYAEARWVRLAAGIVIFFGWLVIVAWVVAMSSHAKHFQW